MNGYAYHACRIAAGEKETQRRLCFNPKSDGRLIMETVARETDAMVTRISQPREIVEPEDRQGLRQLAATLKDVSAVGRDTYQLGNRDDPKATCIVNLGFLQGYSQDPLITKEG